MVAAAYKPYQLPPEFSLKYILYILLPSKWVIINVANHSFWSEQNLERRVWYGLNAAATISSPRALDFLLGKALRNANFIFEPSKTGVKKSQNFLRKLCHMIDNNFYFVFFFFVVEFLRKNCGANGKNSIRDLPAPATGNIALNSRKTLYLIHCEGLWLQ